jgi:hypothetical protein
MTDREILLNIALDLSGIEPDLLTTAEKNILRLLRDKRIVRKDIVTGVFSINPDANKST